MDDFDSRQKPTSRASPTSRTSRASRTSRTSRARRTSRNSRTSRDPESVGLELQPEHPESESWPHLPNVPWSQILDSHNARKRTSHSRFCSRLQRCLALLFVAGYIALVAFLVLVVVEERTAFHAHGGDSAECQQILCPLDSLCQLNSTGQANCVAVSLANLQLMEVILGIVVGVPSLICIPWVALWMLGPKAGRTPDSGRDWRHAKDPQSGSLLGKPAAYAAHTTEAQAGRASDAHATAAPPAAVAAVTAVTAATATPVETDAEDGLKDLFAPLARHQRAVEQAEDELNVLFAPKQRPRHEPEVFLAPPKPPSGTDMESAFSALFHRRARLPQTVQAPSVTGKSELRSDFSAGMSALFASVQRARLNSISGHQSEASRARPKASTIVEDVEEGAESALLDDDLGDPPDFFGFAQRIAGGSVQRSPSRDSLEHLAEDDLAELFHQ